MPAKRKSRANTVSYDRNIRINRGTFLGPSTSRNLDSSSQINDMNDSPVRRSSRIRTQVARYNCGLVKCVVCMKTFRDDVPVEFYVGPVACSFECFKKAARSFV